MTALHLRPVEAADHFVFPDEYVHVTGRSPALTVFTDFLRHEPLVIDGWMSAVEAERHMRQSHTNLRLVVDHAGEFIGTVSLGDLSERNLMRRVAKGEARDDIQVIDLMRHRHEIRALDYDDLESATVRDVVDTLRCHGETHCLVVDRDGRRIRGLITAVDIARRLHHVDLGAAPTFAEIFAAIRSTQAA